MSNLTLAPANQLEGLLKLAEFVAARVRHLDNLEWKIAYGFWTILVLAAAAVRDGQPVWLPNAYALAVLHAAAIFMLYVSQWRTASQWERYIEKVAALCGASWERSSELLRVIRWGIWLGLEALVTFVIARAAGA